MIRVKFVKTASYNVFSMIIWCYTVYNSMETGHNQDRQHGRFALATPHQLGRYSSTTICHYRTITYFTEKYTVYFTCPNSDTLMCYSSDPFLLNLLRSILTILLTCPNSDALLCYSNDPFINSGCIEGWGV